MTTPYILSDTPWKTVRDTGYEIAVLPWGATEAHNYHLPYGTDTIETVYIANISAQKAWRKGVHVVTLPAIPMGVNTSQMDIYMTMNLNPSTQFTILSDILENLKQHGIRKFVVLNGHGGNDFRAMIRELQPKFPGIFICQLNWYETVPLDHFFEEKGDHANEMETSIMMYISPGLVLPLDEAGEGKAKQPRFLARKEGWVWFPRAWTRVTEDTGIGNPKKATAAKGQQYLETVTDKIADFFFELSATGQEDLYE